MSKRLRAHALATALFVSGVTFAVSSPAAADQPVTYPDISTPMPEGYISDLVVDDTHRQIFISMKQPDAVLVAGFDGVITDTITGITTPWNLAIDDDDSTVYVVQGGFYSGFGALATIDTQTHEVADVAMPEDHCPDGVTFTGGKVWYSYLLCDGFYEGSLGSYDPATGVFTGAEIFGESGEVTAMPGRPDRVLQLDQWTSDGRFRVFDVSSGTPVEVASVEKPYCHDAALIAAGNQMVSGCEYPRGPLDVRNTADLSPATPIDIGQASGPVTSTDDGRFLAAAFEDPDTTEAKIAVLDVEHGAPGEPIRRFAFPDYDAQVVSSSLEFAADGTLFAVTSDHYSGTPDLLRVFDDATKFATFITVEAPEHILPGDVVHATGALSGGPGTATLLTLSRTDRAGVHAMGEVPVAADGTFSFEHDPVIPGPVSYTLTWPGDDARGTSNTTVAVHVKPLPFDVDGDGDADLVVGAPGEDVDGAADSGLFHVLPGGPTGVTGAGSTAYDQRDRAYPDENTTGDRLGHANASGDFDRDGYADVVVAVPGEDYSQPDAGGLVVYFGSASGLRADTAYAMSSGHGNTSFARSLAVGDFNGDAHDDLAVGRPDQYSGYTHVFFGSEAGLRNIDYGVDYVVLYQGSDDVPGSRADGDGFGHSLAAGDVNGDGRDDLAIGAVGDAEETGLPTGSVTVLYGSADGPTGVGAQRFTKETPGVPGSAGGFDPATGDAPDTFGNDVELADLNGDGSADLAVAAAGAAADGRRDAGTVTVLYSDGTAIATTGAVEVTQSTSGVPGSPRSEDRFGGTITAGDADGDSRAELVVYSPGDTRVTVIPGGPGGLAFAKAKGWTQNTSGVPGDTEAGDDWGGALRFADLKGDGHLALVVGAAGENVGEGMVTVIYAGPHGLTASGSKTFDQDSLGVPGDSESDDRFGALG
ncbi:FG-GAP and VCBS repeat-containing protein [Phytomonospora sp. NPDC050363]|uniref:FG-GAP and VCBS repeat-containing protein n=1 Tax=Phytomonospora sp. NPDC050363 TaxID=3155642 RepID=UPI0033F37F98